MRELAKMATGLAAKSGIGPWLRAILFVGLALGVWQFWLWIARHDPPPAFAVVSLSVANLMVLLISAIEYGLLEHKMRWIVQRLPLTLLAEFTKDGEDVRLWMLLVWPFLVPAELVICVGTAIAAVASVALWILNIKLK